MSKAMVLSINESIMKIKGPSMLQGSLLSTLVALLSHGNKEYRTCPWASFKDSAHAGCLTVSVYAVRLDSLGSMCMCQSI